MMGKIENVPNHQPVIGDVTDVSEVICGWKMVSPWFFTAESESGADMKAVLELVIASYLSPRI
jgi:hypothetical protein